MTTAITVTIGRNILGGSEELELHAWELFKTRTREAVRRAAEDRVLWVDADYVGEWELHTEDAHVFVAPAKSAAAVEVLRTSLKVLATRFGQDAIGLVSGDAELIESF